MRVESSAMRIIFMLALLVTMSVFVEAAVGQSSPNAHRKTAPAAIQTNDPEYTPEAKEHRIQGAVLVNAIIGTDGKAHEVTVKKGLGYGLDEKAIEAVKQWRFQPATVDGQAVMTKVTLEVGFRLH